MKTFAAKSNILSKTVYISLQLLEKKPSRNLQLLDQLWAGIKEPKLFLRVVLIIALVPNLVPSNVAAQTEKPT